MARSTPMSLSSCRCQADAQQLVGATETQVRESLGP